MWGLLNPPYRFNWSTCRTIRPCSCRWGWNVWEVREVWKSCNSWQTCHRETHGESYALQLAHLLLIELARSDASPCLSMLNYSIPNNWSGRSCLQCCLRRTRHRDDSVCVILQAAGLPHGISDLSRCPCKVRSSSSRWYLCSFRSQNCFATASRQNV